MNLSKRVEQLEHRMSNGEGDVVWVVVLCGVGDAARVIGYDRLAVGGR